MTYSNRKGVRAYLLIAFGLAWVSLVVAWSLGIRAPGANAGLLDYALLIGRTLPISFAPAIAAFIVRKWITSEGFQDAGLRLNLRRTWPYFLFAWLYPLLVIPAVIALATMTRLGVPDYANLAPGEVAVMMMVAIGTTPIVFGEEFGWRSYLQIRIFVDRPWLAAMVTGCVWGIWHYPMILLGYLFPGEPLAGLVLYPINMAVTSVIYGWLRLKSGSVWSDTLAHSTGNNVITNLLLSLFGQANWTLMWGGLRLAVLAVLSAGIILSGQLGRPQRNEASSPFDSPGH